MNLTVATANTTVPFTTSTAVSGGGANWITVSPQGGTAPTMLQVGVLTGSMPNSAGSYTGQITITPTQAGVNPTQIQVTLNIGPQLTLSQGTVINLAWQSGTQVPSMSFSVDTTTGVAVPITISNISAQGGVNWLNVNANNTVTPAQVTIDTNPANLGPGNYQGQFTITSSNASVTPVTVMVNLSINASPTLTATPTRLDFAYQTGTTPSVLTRTISFTTNSPGTNGQVAFNVSAPDQPWFTVFPTNGVASKDKPVLITVQVNTQNLPANTYQGSIAITPVTASANGPITIPISLLVSPNPILSLSAQPQTFNFQTGGSNPPDQTVIINSSSATAITYSIGSLPSWLTVTPMQGNAPGSLTLHVNPAGLIAGTYSTNVSVTAAGAANSPLTFPVTLVVAATNMLNASSGGLTFNYQTSSAQLPGSQFFTVTSTGANVPLSPPAIQQQPCGGKANWVTAIISPTGTSTPATLIVSVEPAGITAPQTCSATIAISANGASNTVNVPVTLNVSATALLNVFPPDLTFIAPLGAATLPARTFVLSSTDPNTSISFSAVSDAPWLTVAPNIGNTSSNGTLQVTVTPQTFIQTGVQTGHITVTRTDGTAQPAQVFTVTLNIVSPNSFTVSSTTLAIAASFGGQPVSQPLNLTVSNGGAATYSATASVQVGINWLKLSTDNGASTALSVSGNAPGTLTVIADPTGLQQGSYKGTIAINAQGVQSGTASVDVTLTVGPAQAITLSAASLSYITQVGATTAISQTFNIASNGGNLPFTITKGTGCDAFAVTPATGTATATPAPITVALNPTGLQLGNSTCALTIASQGLPNQTVNLTVSVGQAPTPSIITIQNGASYIPGAVAPGEIVYVTGTNLGPVALTQPPLNSNPPFPTTLADTQVLFDGFAAPILYVRADVIAAVVPFEIAGRGFTNIQVKRLGQTSATIQQRVVDVAPGVFTINAQGFGQAAAVNSNGTVNGPTNPAAKGTQIAIYMTGAGLTSPLTATGSITPPTLPLPEVPTSVPYSVTIDGLPAATSYFGEAPYLIAGAYQLNVTVPTSIQTSGAKTLLIKVGSGETQANVTVYVQ